MRKILVSLMIIALVCALIGGGVYAVFSDTETSTSNTFAAGTLDLDISGGDADVKILVTSITDVVPGSSAIDSRLLEISGTVAGELDVAISTVISDDNGLIVDAETVGGSDGSTSPGLTCRAFSPCCRRRG